MTSGGGDEFDAVVLAGGPAVRMGGVDKVLEEVGGRALIEVAIDAVGAARRIVVAGPRRALDLAPELGARITWVREEPPGAGPAHALAAALAHTEAPLVALVAADMPFVDRAVVGRLASGVGSRDGAIATSGGRDQPLLGVYRRAALVAAGSRLETTEGASMTAVISGLDLHRSGELTAAIDCDTEEELRAARARFSGGRHG